MSLFSRLFGGSSTPQPESEPETYKDYRIFAEPVRAAGGFRVAARIEKDIGGATRTHHLVRADICDSLDTAREVLADFGARRADVLASRVLSLVT